MKRGLTPLLLPGLLGAGLFYAVPLLLTLVKSLEQPAGYGPGSYAAALSNPMLRLGAVNFLRFALVAVPATLALALGLALLLRGTRQAGGLLFALVLPFVLPSGATAFFWSTVFGLNGVLNRLLYQSGREIVLWQSGPQGLVIPVVLFLWRCCGLFTLLLLAALESIPREQYEIARLEGAGRRALFLHITLPRLASVLPAAAVLALLGSFRISRELFILFGSYPGRDLYLLQHFINNQLGTLNLPLLCAASVLVILAVSLAVLPLWSLGGELFDTLARQGAPDRSPSRKSRRRLLLALPVAALFLLPVLFTLANSLLPAAEAAARYSAGAAAGNSGGLFRGGLHFAEPTLLPRHPSLEQYAAFLRDPAGLRMLWNAVLLTLPAVLLQTGVSAAAGYGLWRARERRWARHLFPLCLLLAAIPPQVMLPPQYVLFRGLGLGASAWAVVLPAAFSPLGLCLVRLQLAGFPADCIEAARLDGAGEGRVLREIVLPGLRGTMALLVVYTFAECWNTVDQAVVFLNGWRLPLSVTLSAWEALPAASVLYLLPPALLFAACLLGAGEEQ